MIPNSTSEAFLVKKRALDWFLWQLGFPLVTILVFGYLANWIKEINDPWRTTLASCDLIFFSGVLLLGVAVALRQEQEMAGTGISENLGFEFRLQLCRLLSFVIFGSIGFLRIRASKFNEEYILARLDAAAAGVPGAAFSVDANLVIANVATALLATAFSVYGFWSAVSLRLGSYRNG